MQTTSSTIVLECAKYSNRSKRNSSVEMLRILSMLMIVTSHCVMFTNLNVLEQAFGINKVCIETFLYSGGKIGVVSFFAISAWYLSQDGGVQSGLRRVWILEREMLFWSVILLAVTALIDQTQLSIGLITRSLFPMITALWWYPTAYSVFLLFFPFLSQSLRAFGKSAHGALCLMMFMLWTVLDMVMPLSAVGLPGGNYLSFIYIYVLIMYYRWHMKPIKISTAWWMLAIGYTAIALGSIGGGLLYERTGRLAVLQVYLGKVEFRLPVLMIGLALFVLFERHEFHSAIVNMVASSMFGVYLITEYPTIRMWIWESSIVNSLVRMNSIWVIATIVIAASLVLIICVVLDQIREQLFRVTVDRHRGAWFDKLWNVIGNIIKQNTIKENR